MATPNAAVPAGGAQAQAQAPLEELMVAMDVVDTMRHRQLLVDRELNADQRRANLRERLREIYTAQGIEVTDDALDAGIAALEEERFAYAPVEGGFSVRLAKLYVTRARWGGAARLIGGFALVVLAVWYFAVGYPEQRLRSELPADLASVYEQIVETAEEDAALTQARTLNASAEAAIADEDYDAADEARDALHMLLDRLEAAYEVRVVSRPNEPSGVWRVPGINETARNFYLIVEAVTPSGEIVEVPVVNEEDGETYVVASWGVRVDEQTFERIAADKLDDGIIQGRVVGMKELGRLTPEYRVATPGGTITEW